MRTITLALSTCVCLAAGCYAQGQGQGGQAPPPYAPPPYGPAYGAPPPYGPAYGAPPGGPGYAPPAAPPGAYAPPPQAPPPQAPPPQAPPPAQPAPAPPAAGAGYPGWPQGFPWPFPMPGATGQPAPPPAPGSAAPPAPGAPPGAVPPPPVGRPAPGPGAVPGGRPGPVGAAPAPAGGKGACTLGASPSTFRTTATLTASSGGLCASQPRLDGSLTVRTTGPSSAHLDWNGGQHSDDAAFDPASCTVSKGPPGKTETIQGVTGHATYTLSVDAGGKLAGSAHVNVDVPLMPCQADYAASGAR